MAGKIRSTILHHDKPTLDREYSFKDVFAYVQYLSPIVSRELFRFIGAGQGDPDSLPFATELGVNIIDMSEGMIGTDERNVRLLLKNWLVSWNDFASNYPDIKFSIDATL
mgnify:CR=1 FL=1